MKIKYYQIDTFTNQLFSGNSAGVCLLEYWIDVCLMQKIAMNNNLSETAFIVPDGEQFQIRWFTPITEVNLCGHATLASAFILFADKNNHQEMITFFSPQSGYLYVKQEGKKLSLDFPVDNYQPIEISREMRNAFPIEPVEVYKGNTDFMFVFENQEQVTSMSPDFQKIASIGGRGTIITAPGEDTDFVSRYYAPQSGIDEDPVTGSAHTTLTPYWSQRLSKKLLTARQLSARTGYLTCEDKGDRISISGECVLYLTGLLTIK